MRLRQANRSDIPAMMELCQQSIQQIAKANYSPTQIKAWANRINNVTRFEEALAEQYFVVAETDEKLAGFSSLKNGEYIDFMYVSPQHQKQGIAKQLLQHILEKAREYETKTVWSDISKTARPFFERHGFSVEHENENVIGNVQINNFKMVKEL